MLPPFIIEEIRRREEALRREQDQLRIELPQPIAVPPPKPHSDDDDRGVVIIDL